MWPFNLKGTPIHIAAFDPKVFLGAMPADMGQDGGMVCTVEVLQPDGKLFQVRDGARVLFTCPVDMLAQIALLP